MSVFAPMKKWWRQIVGVWKEETARQNKNFATLPKQEFPGLLKQLLDKDYKKAIISGFECTGLFPLNPDRVLAKLPKENPDVESVIQRQLLEKLASMRYDQPKTTHANRPKKKDKLPAGASYTCRPGQTGLVGLPVDRDASADDSDIEEVTQPVEEESDDSDREEMRNQTENIIQRLGRGKRFKAWRTDEDQGIVTTSDSDSEDSSHSSERMRKNSRRKVNDTSEEEDKDVEEDKDEEQEEQHKEQEEAVSVDQPEDDFPIGSYVAAVYQREWFVGQVLDKSKESKALKSDDYIYVSFMQRVQSGKDLFRWPDKADKLNTLREDVLFECGAPVPSHSTSTTRSISYSLTVHEIKRANHLMTKAFYHTIFLVFSFYLFFRVANPDSGSGSKIF